MVVRYQEKTRSPAYDSNIHRDCTPHAIRYIYYTCLLPLVLSLSLVRRLLYRMQERLLTIASLSLPPQDVRSTLAITDGPSFFFTIHCHEVAPIKRYVSFRRFLRHELQFLTCRYILAVVCNCANSMRPRGRST